MSLALDSRQRAMLEEMGIKLWQPEDMVRAQQAPLATPDTAVVATPIHAKAAPAAQAHEPSGAPFKPEPRPGGVETMDWPALQSVVSGCRACGLCQRRKNAVFGVGPQRADWLVVGEAPGEEEDLAGEPFVGASGRLLDNMLKAIGLSREALAPAKLRSAAAQAQASAGQDLAKDGSGLSRREAEPLPGGAQRLANVYITNVLKCRPPFNRNPETNEVAQCTPYLRRQIELLAPRIILAVGRFAANALLQGLVEDVERVPLGRLRGKSYSYLNNSKNIPVVVTYHPAYLLRNLPAKAQAWEDLCLALQVAQDPSQSPAGS